MCATPAKLAARPEPSDLIRGLGLWSATAVVVSETIGTGIFLVTSDMAHAVGSATLVLAAWVIGGVIALNFGPALVERSQGGRTSISTAV